MRSVEGRSLLVVSPKVGHGNPFAAIALTNSADGESNLISGGFLLILEKLHKEMTNRREISREYTRKSETVRRGLAGVAIGATELAQWLINERLTQLKGGPLANIGIFVQEHLLGVLPKEVLKKWFPEGVFLYIPDVFPKESAVEILKRLKGIVTPLVWNRSAWQELTNQGLTPILVAPVLPEGFLSEEQLTQIRDGSKFSSQKGQPKIIIKTSGSGIGTKLDEWLKENLIKKAPQDQRIEYWRPEGRSIYDGSNSSTQETQETSDLTQYGRDFYSSLLDATVIISYPSEMVQVVAWLKAQGWPGEFIVLPPRGAHEKRNYEWAKKMGLIDGEIKEEGSNYEKIEFSNNEFNPGSFKIELGTTSMVQIVSLARSGYQRLRRVAISSEAKKLYPEILLTPSLTEERVIKDPEELDSITDFSQIVSVHFRPKSTEGFWEKLTGVVDRIKEKVGKENDFYLSIHLDDLAGLSEEEIKIRLSALNNSVAGTGIKILLENVTPRVDENLDPSCYSLLAFYQKYKQEIDSWGNIGFCLDIAHLGLAEPEVLSVLEKYYQGKEDGWRFPEMMLEDKERALFFTFQSVLKRTKVLHWSQGQGLKPIEMRQLFRIFKKVLSKFRNKGIKEKVHHLYSLIENLISAHYPITTDSDLFVIITTIIRDFGWDGIIVIESPAVLEMVRNQQIPFEYFERLKFLTSPQAITELDYLSQGKISDYDLVDLVFFLEPELTSANQDFFPFFKKTFSLILDIYNGQRRKVNGGLYLRHILKTTMIAYQLARTYGFDDEVKERIVLGSLLHDAFEMNPSYNETRLSDQLREIFPKKTDQWIEIVVKDVRFLTPLPKDPNLDYLERKRQDFERFIPKDENGEEKPFDQWSNEERSRFLIKIADIAANLFETVNDLEKGKDNGLMNKPLELIYLVFKERWQLIKKIILFSSDSSLVNYFEKLLKKLEGYLSNGVANSLLN